MPNRYHFEYEFHPVGQGLFASGAIYNPDVAIYNPRPVCRFRWVYDCGTVSPQQLVTDSLNDFAENIPGSARQRLQLATISHFDKDHISGIPDLLRRFTVDNLMLPYMALPLRLAIAFEEGIDPGDPDMGFFIDPVAWVAGLDGSEVRRILFVPPSNGESSGPERPKDAKPDLGEGPLELNTPEGPEADPEYSASAIRPRIQFLPNGAVLRAGGLWEFVPYNDDPHKPITPALIQEVEARRNALLQQTDSAARLQALNELKQTYDGHFGSGSEARNVISLHLYGGPVYDSWHSTVLAYARKVLSRKHPDVDMYFEELRSFSEQLHNESKCSVLYTGDGYLDRPDRLERLINYVHASRINRVGVFQVMHHGAKGNSCPGLAERIAPLYSIFSSDPDDNRHNHPDAEVYRDFLKYHPMPINRHHAFVRGWMFPRT